MSNKSGDFDDIELIWGILSGDDLSGAAKPTMHTMNDLALIHWKESDTYSVDIETIYDFPEKANELAYLRNLLNEFTVWMKGQGRSVSSSLQMELFFFNPNDGRFRSIEEAYTAFRMMVEGYAAVHWSEK